MNTTPNIPATRLLERWDRQQEGYIRNREERFTAIVRTIEYHCGPAPRILDLACGPGSLTARIRAAVPESHCVGIDKDPVLLRIAQEVFANDPHVDVVTGDLNDASWQEALDGSRFDAIVSSTALHWLMPPILARLYFELPALLTEEGVFLNGDHFLYSKDAEPRLRAIAKSDDERTQRETFTVADSWDEWWRAVLEQERYEEASAQREQIWAAKSGPVPKVSAGFHLETLRSAGFREVGTVWQYFDDYVIAAFR